MRAIIDTNVLVSGLLSASGPPRRVIDAMVAGRVTALFSPATLEELRSVLGRPRLRPYLQRAAVDVDAFMALSHWTNCPAGCAAKPRPWADCRSGWTCHSTT